MIDAETLAPLLAEADPAVSLYLPFDPGQRDVRAAEAVLAEALGELEARLARAVPATRARTLLAEVRGLLDGLDLTHHREPGLALFAGGAAPLMLPLATAPAQRVAVVGRHFHLRPLLPLLAQRQRFRVLALSARKVRLLEMTPFGWHELPVDALPPDAQAELDSLPAGREDRDETQQHLLTENLHRVATAVRTALGGDAAPVLLVAEPHLGGHFRKTAAAHMPQLQPELLALNPHAFPDSELHARALEAMRPFLDADLRTALDQVNARLGTAEPTVSLRLEEILEAAEAARVETLVVDRDATLWGHFEMGHHVSAHGHQAATDEDLLNQAAVVSLRNGARVHVAPHDSMPRQAQAAATFRF